MKQEFAQNDLHSIKGIPPHRMLIQMLYNGFRHFARFCALPVKPKACRGLSRSRVPYSLQSCPENNRSKSYQPAPVVARGLQEPISPASARAFRKTLALARESGAVTRLLVSPFLPAHISRLHDLYDKRKTEIENLAGGLHVWDYSGALNDDRCFADPLHMNLEGARPVLRKMAADGFFAIPAPE